MIPRLWSRIHGETDAAYAAFSAWLHTTDGEGRRDPPYEHAKKQHTAEQTSEILKWAVQDFWLERAAAYNEYVGKRKIIKHFPFFSAVAVLMQKIVRVELERLSKAQDAAGDMPGGLDIRVIRGWATEIRKAEEYAARAEAAQAAALTAGDSAYDFTKLEIEELRVLEKLHNKAKI
jgi:hypothetical protein